MEQVREKIIRITGKVVVNYYPHSRTTKSWTFCTLLCKEPHAVPGTMIFHLNPRPKEVTNGQYWSPNYLGRVFRAETGNGDPENHQRQTDDAPRKTSEPSNWRRANLL